MSIHQKMHLWTSIDVGAIVIISLVLLIYVVVTYYCFIHRTGIFAPDNIELTLRQIQPLRKITALDLSSIERRNGILNRSIKPINVNI